MKKPSETIDPNTASEFSFGATERLRQKIRLELQEIEINLDGIKGAEIERRSKALTSLFKLTQALDEHDEKQASRRAEQTQKTHTLYAEIPPPTDDEMRAIQDRLNSLYSRLRSAQDPILGPAKPDPDGKNSA